MDRDLNNSLTRLMAELNNGRTHSPEELLELLYKNLRHIAAGYMRKERADHTLQATALVNEAYLKLFSGQPFRWENRKHLFCTMAQTMRRLLVDYARNRETGKRGGRNRKLSLDRLLVASEEKTVELLALDQALERLAALNPRQANVIEMRFYVGLTVEETAAMLDVSPETVALDWRFAKAWLKNEVERCTPNGRVDG